MKTAIVHYWLCAMRGGEKMLECLLELYPDADIYTHVYKPSGVSEIIKSHKIYTSYINKLPFAKKFYQIYLPLMPDALLRFDMQSYDLIISSEAGPAKGITPRPGAYHLCYCHSPMRYIWDMYHEYSKDAGILSRFFMRVFTPSLRVWDICSANLVDRFVCNSNYTAARVRRYYRRGAQVVFGPVNIEYYESVMRNPLDYYLFFGQVTYNKRVDIAVDACIRLGRKIIVAGTVSSKKLVSKYKKNPLVKFAGNVSAEQIKKYFSGARALLFPGIEDMGIVPIEAQAAGCPVIAYRRGGVLDTVIENLTGIFFCEQTAESLEYAIIEFESKKDLFKERSVFSRHVKQFSKEAFKERIRLVVEERRTL